MSGNGQRPKAVVERIEFDSVVERVDVGMRLLFGRSEECDVVIQNRRVSRNHAQISYRSGQYLLVDLRSSNGTYLNGTEITGEAVLNYGDEIDIDEYLFRFVDAEPPTMAESPTNILYSLATPSPTVNPTESRLQAVMAVAASISRSLTQEALFNDVLKAVMTVFRAANRAFVLTVDATEDLQIRSRLTRFDAENALAHAPVSRFVAQKVFSAGEAILSLNAADDPQLDPSASVRDLQIASLICAPIPGSNGKTLGVVYVDSFSKGKTFDEHSLEMLATISTIVGQFVENARLQETRLRAELLQREMQLAQDVQQMLVPSNPPELLGYGFAHEYEPAGVLAGDYVDYIELADGRVAIAIGDVAGKGAPAALMMARMSSAVRLVLQGEQDIAAAIQRLDAVLAEKNEAMLFASFAIFVLDPATHQVMFVDAGHPQPILKRGSTAEECFDTENKGTVLGIGTGRSFRNQTMPLHPGESLVMITDGVTEARNEERDLFGVQRLIAAVQSADDSAEGIRAEIVRQVGEFQHGDNSDDMSIVVLRRDL